MRKRVNLRRKLFFQYLGDLWNCVNDLYVRQRALALDSVTITDGGRAKDELGWKPSGPSFEDSVGVDVDRVLNL